MRSILLVLALAVVAAAAVAATPESASAPAVDTSLTAEDLPAAAVGVDLPGEACGTLVAADATAGFCPFGSPICREHDDCDEYCGSPEFGYCEILGYFPDGCCLCLG